MNAAAPRTALQFPGFIVDALVEIEGVEAEMQRPAGRVEHQDIARVLERPVGNVDRLAQQLLLR